MTISVKGQVPARGDGRARSMRSLRRAARQHGWFSGAVAPAGSTLNTAGSPEESPDDDAGNRTARAARRRHRVAAGVDGARAADDAGAGFLLRRAGAAQERAEHDDDERGVAGRSGAD